MLTEQCPDSQYCSDTYFSEGTADFTGWHEEDGTKIKHAEVAFGVFGEVPEGCTTNFFGLIQYNMHNGRHFNSAYDATRYFLESDLSSLQGMVDRKSRKQVIAIIKSGIKDELH